MPVAQNTFTDTFGSLAALWFAIVHGGWIIIAWAFIYMLWFAYKEEIQHQFLLSQEWIFLSIRVPRLNETSLMGVEHMLNQMHQLHVNLTFAEKWVEGRIQLWYALEMVSLGGKISFVIRIPARQRATVESAIYGQFPAAEIVEVDDYLKHVTYDSKAGDFDLFGFEYRVLEDFSVPIRTYKDFEHPAAEQKILDPLAGMYEALAKVAPDEFYGVQILIQPLGDAEWKDHGEAYVKKLIGEEAPHETHFKDLILAPFTFFAKFSWGSLLGLGTHDKAHDPNKPQRNQKNDWMSLTDVEKERVNAIQRKLGKPGYKTKIRNLYIAPKGKLDLSKRGAVIGAFRPFTSAQLNSIKPDLKKTWTSMNYAVSPTVEKPYLDWEVARRKRLIFKAYKARSTYIGLPATIFNVEELATLYHFPLATEEQPSAAPVEAIESKKSQPPVNLPIG